MPDVIRHPAGGGGGGLDSCLRRNDGRLHRIVIGASLPLTGLFVDHKGARWCALLI